jgi:DNA polymerase-3 subunit gamma/tau
MQSSKRFRPRSLDALVGQDRLVRQLRGQFKKKTLPSGYMFTGPKGSGKTTAARIIAVSLQCTHQKKFGIPCKACWNSYSEYPIYEINCGQIRGVEDLEQFISNADYEIIGKGKRRVYILDEAHRLSGHAQDTLLIPTEKNNKNVWIICSTKEDKIAETLRSRFQVYSIATLNAENVNILVRTLLERHESELSVDDLADALVDNGIFSARLIANAVDKYVGGASAEEAAYVDGVATIDGKALIRAIIKGDWPDVTVLLKKTSVGDVRQLRGSIIGYLRAILLDSTELDARTNAVAEGIKRLTYINMSEEHNQLAALSAELYTLCTLFSKYSH